ncbi:MAG: sigma-70 family RNA polymerase sigma factor [Cytophagales bacterium]
MVIVLENILGSWFNTQLWLFSNLFKNNQHEISEEQLVLLSQKKSKYFSKIYDLYHHKIFNYIYRRLKDMDVTADITSETFVKAFSHIHKYKKQEVGFSSWLYKIASNEINQYFREHQTHTRHVALYSNSLEQFVEMDESFDVNIKMSLLQNAIKKLSMDEIQLLEWRFYENLSYKEIGFLCEISEDNAKVRTYRLIDKLKRIIAL